jgi:cytochrome P450
MDGYINEALRLYPPAPAGVQRRTPPQGTIIDGKLVPGKTQLSVHPHAIQRDERYFSKPDEWIPERWVESRRPSSFNHNVRAFLPFTTGQYTCLGKNLAYQEVRLFLAKLVRNFDFKLAPGFEPEFFDRNIRYKGTFLIVPLDIVLTERRNK